ncbi:NUDIX domain-containing protein [Galbibacter sp. EGI 63066]|uniref:NUDIX domain-containing protein n=1 Tax=Galbibacter sp. EGI 63066 TaxID=2993559 RepID=UPI0022499143|nr:NUDIX domain-containing protein [Galbibacter sp. EGI 63066]MCX2679235.1 NUDIX domain-containing protein [Galbibacter sp. EGI 63066]
MNKGVKINKETTLSNNWYTLKKVDFSYQLDDGSWEEQSREVYDRGNGAAILLYNKNKGTVVLTRQFRMPTYLNGNENGMMIEVPAGIIEDESPKASIIRETEEETGFEIKDATKVLQTYTSPGAVSETLHLFVAEYSDTMKVHEGGGLEEENENIEVFEVPFTQVEAMVKNGDIKDAKTIMLIQYARINKLL